MISDTLRHYILTTALPGEPPDTLRDDTPLLSSGILDSLAALGLVSFIEKTYGIELDVYETGVDRFDSIAAIAATIERRMAA
jgi:acyl carrier protein